MVVDGVRQAAQAEDGHLCPGLAQLAFRHSPGRYGAGGRLLCGGEGSGHAAPGHGQAGESHGGDKLPARQVSIFGFPAHGKFLFRTHFVAASARSTPYGSLGPLLQ